MSRGTRRFKKCELKQVSFETYAYEGSVGTGVSDAQWHEMKQRCEALGELSAEAATEQYSIPKALKPDVSVVPGLIVEIAADEITRSPVHSAGVALRFPRLVKFRDDKNVSQATTVAEVEKVGGV
jgi:DNA ligase-1